MHIAAGWIRSRLKIWHGRVLFDTHNDLRLAVNPLSGELSGDYIRCKLEKCPVRLKKNSDHGKRNS
jgi:hypothetical protein